MNIKALLFICFSLQIMFLSFQAQYYLLLLILSNHKSLPIAHGLSFLRYPIHPLLPWKELVFAIEEPSFFLLNPHVIAKGGKHQRRVCTLIVKCSFVQPPIIFDEELSVAIFPEGSKNVLVTTKANLLMRSSNF